MVFFIVVILISVSWAIYLAWRLSGNMSAHRYQAACLAACIFAILALTPCTIVLRRVGVEGLGLKIVAWTGYLGLGVLSFLFAFLTIRDVLRMLRLISKKLLPFVRRIHDGRSLCRSVDREGRRHFLLNGMNYSMMAGSCLMTGYGFLEARKIPLVKEVSISVAGLPRDLVGLRIVQITDIHVGPTLGRSFVESIVSVVNGLKPHIIALTGDLADGPVQTLSRAVQPLADLEATYGKFFVTGNHEYYSGALEWVEEVKRLGFTVLLNEHRIIRKGSGTLLLAGVTDLRGGQFFPSHSTDPEKAVYGASEADTRILLAHQPKSAFEAEKAKFDLQISGHTHGGQFFPWNLFVGLFQPFVAGLYRYKHMQIYVSRGTGYWGPPVRLGSPSEITLLTMTT